MKKIILKYVSSLPFLLVVIFSIILASLYPFKAFTSWSDVLGTLQDGMTLSIPAPAVNSIFQRLITFLPLGLLIQIYISNYKWRRPELIAIAAVSLIALSIELGQAALSQRHALLSDFIIASFAGAIGVALGSLFAQTRSALRRSLITALTIGNGVIVLMLLMANEGATIKNWNCEYPLLVANELTMDRPWKGRIRGLALYPKDISLAQATVLSKTAFTSENMDVRQNLGALSVYMFSNFKKSRFQDMITHNEDNALELVATQTKNVMDSADHALELDKPVLIRSVKTPAQICNSIMQSQAFTVEVEVESLDHTQSGPARIVSNSINPGMRNFTLGEDKGDFVLRVRTPNNGNNGSLLQMRFKRAAASEGFHHVIASYAHGVAKILIDGVGVASEKSYYDYLVIDGKVPIYINLPIGIILLLLGFCAVYLAGQSSLSRGLTKSFLAVSLVQITGYLAISWLYNNNVDWLLLMLFIFMPALGVVLKRWVLPEWHLV
jgi:VanZ family protein